MLGATVNNYQVWGRLSQGGMSDVWLARHAELALPVVIKVPHRAPGESLELVYQRLLAEARMTARLTSPRVVRVIDVGLHTPPSDVNRQVEPYAVTELPRAVEGVPQAEPFLVEEYVDGIDLAEFDRRRRQALHRPLPLWVVADYVAQAAEGLHAAHQAGIVHRDVKPSNLFGYGHGAVKLGDFGIAAVSGTDDAPHAGTALFMAPEQFAGARTDRRTDVYSLGATAFALRYGAAPYTTLGEALREGAAPRFPVARSPEEAYFQHVVSRMLAPRPEQRDPHILASRHRFMALTRATMPRPPLLRANDTVFHLGDVRISFEVGDLARIETDALVNSTTTQMSMRAGVGDALRRRGGDALEAEAMALGDRALGDCVLTHGGLLPVRGVLHAVAAWNQVLCIARTTHRALLLAEENGFRRLAFPALGTGRGRVALEACADAMVGALRQHLLMGGSRLEEVRFVFYTPEDRARALEVAIAALQGTDDVPALFLDDTVTSAAESMGHVSTVLVPHTPTERIRG